VLHFIIAAMYLNAVNYPLPSIFTTPVERPAASCRWGDRLNADDPSTLQLKALKNNQRENNQRENSRDRRSRFPFTFPFAVPGTYMSERDRFQNSCARSIRPVPVIRFYRSKNALKNDDHLWLANCGCDRMNVLSIANNYGGLAGKQGKYAAFDSD